MNEFQATLTNYAARQDMSISELAKCAGYDALLFENIVTGKSRQVPVDFFVRVANALDLSNEEKDALVRSWAFGVEQWNWPQSDESSQRRPAQELRESTVSASEDTAKGDVPQEPAGDEIHQSWWRRLFQ
jgi:hypothetical protein